MWMDEDLDMGGRKMSKRCHLFFTLKYFFPLCSWVFCLHVCLCLSWVPGACRGPKSVSGPLGLELQTAEGQLVGTGNRT